MAQWLPAEDDRAFIEQLMQPVATPGEFASWIAPPSKGIATKPIEFEYVRLP